VVATGLQLLTEKLLEITDRTDAELNLEQQLGGRATRCLLHSRLVHDETDLLIGRSYNADALGVPANAPMDVGGGGASAPEATSHTPETPIDPRGTGNHALRVCPPGRDDLRRARAESEPRLQQTVASRYSSGSPGTLRRFAP
jgi:hypothetical protein